MEALALIAGFALGAACAVALLFCVKKSAVAAGLSEPAEKTSSGAPTAPVTEPDAPIPVDEQWKNMFSYDGKPQNREDVKQDGN